MFNLIWLKNRCLILHLVKKKTKKKTPKQTMTKTLSYMPSYPPYRFLQYPAQSLLLKKS